MFTTPARLRAALGSLREHRSVTAAVVVDTVGAGLTLSLSVVYFTVTTDLSLAAIGALTTAAALVALPLGLLGGVLTDRFGARASMVTNNVVSAAGWSLYLVAHDPVVVFAAVFLTTASERLYWSSWTAYVHDLADGRPFERWFAFLEATKSAAFGVSAVVAAVALAGGEAALPWLVVANVVTSLAAAVVFATQSAGGRRHHDPDGSELDEGGAVRRRGTVRAFVTDRSMLLVTLGQFLLGPSMVLPNVALSVLFVERWHLPTAVAPVQFAVATGLSAVLQTAVTRRAAGRDRGRLIALGAVLTALPALALVVLPPQVGVAAWAVVVLAGVSLAVADMVMLPAVNAVMAQAPAPRIRGRAIGVFQTAASVGMALYPLTLGLLDTAVPWTLWLLTGALFLGAGWVWTAAVRSLPTHLRVAGVDDADA